MNILITGATGFIGNNLTRKLLNQYDNIKCLVRKSSKLKQLKDLRVELIEGDIKDFSSLLMATKDVDILYHCAALVTDWAPVEEFELVNVNGTKNILDASIINKVRKIIHISSNDAVWNFNNHYNVDETEQYPSSFKHPYSKSKAESEKLVIRYSKLNKIDTVIIRPCLVWGPGDTVILPRLLEMALNNQLIIIGNSKNKVSISYIDNLTDAIISASKNNNAIGQVYFINDGIEITLVDFISSILDTLGLSWSNKKSLPYLVAYTIAFISELYARFSYSGTPPLLTRYAVAAMGKNLTYCIKKAENELNYMPCITFNEGLLNLKNWVDRIGGINSLIR